MLNKLEGFIRRYKLLQPGDRVVCAVSGGADSVALLFAMYLLKEKLAIRVAAAHFNHQLRGEESDRDEAFVKKLCECYDIELYVSSAKIVPGKKGLEAAARDARYAFFKTLPGKIATAHTADDNAETVLLHMVRGTGLKGLGGISPINGNLIRPMLEVTRHEVLHFLQEYNLSFVTDSSNDTDQFLRNRLRRHVMPLLKQENPKLAQNLSSMALRLREDERTLSSISQTEQLPDLTTLRQMPMGLRSRSLAAFLERCGVKEPEAEHILQAEKLVFSDKPSASAQFPGGITICRNYDRLEKAELQPRLQTRILPCPGVLELPEVGLSVMCQPATTLLNEKDAFTVHVQGQLLLRPRQPGDSMRCSGGTKSLKKLFIDSKLPAPLRLKVPVLADDAGVLGVYGFGANGDRLATALPAVQIRFLRI